MHFLLLISSHLVAGGSQILVDSPLYGLFQLHPAGMIGLECALPWPCASVLTLPDCGASLTSNGSIILSFAHARDIGCVLCVVAQAPDVLSQSRLADAPSSIDCQGVVLNPRVLGGLG